MKCLKCHRHFKPERNLELTDLSCPDCYPAGNTVRLEQLFEEILKRHVVLTELREIYRKRLEAILHDKNLDKE